MKWPLWAILALVSCGSGPSSYLERARALPPESAHPRFRELLPLIEQPRDLSLDDLVRTWKQFLGTAAVPLREDQTFTFVYYDFSHTLSQVYLEASFIPQRDLMSRVGQTPLFVRVYSLPRSADTRYRFTDGSAVLPDPFFAGRLEETEFWQPLNQPRGPRSDWVVGASEGALEGRDLDLLLPSGFSTDLGVSYPVVLVIGVGADWQEPLLTLLKNETLRPFVAVAVKGEPDLKGLIGRVVPWIRQNYRGSVQASDLMLVGWGDWSAPVQQFALAHPEEARAWAPTDQSRGGSWATLAPAFLRNQFTVVAP